MTNGLYLYGIFPAPGPTRLEVAGLDKQSVKSCQLDQFTFLYSDAQQARYLASRRNLLGHERVLEHAMEHGFQTLLPLQFGLIIDNWDTVQEQLIAPHREKLSALLHRLDGQREVGVKVFWEPERELEALMAENAALRAERDRLEGRTLSMDEIVRIGQAIEQAMAEREAAIIQKFQVTLNPLSTQGVENDPLAETMIYNAAYLIPWDAEPAFSEKVEELDHFFENRLRIRYNSFTAPFNFAQMESLS